MRQAFIDEDGEIVCNRITKNAIKSFGDIFYLFCVFSVIQGDSWIVVREEGTIEVWKPLYG